MHSIYLILTLFTFGNLLASTPIAEVLKVRGDVTQLSPGAHAARIVMVGDKLIEDTSVLTSSKSFIKIKFIDNSEINLGPDSKIVISEMKSGDPGVIALLKGKIRTEVEKVSGTGKNKFFIKTRTAAMGVRGTDFQTIYNPENKVTSLLTYKGEVAMAKIDESEYRRLENGEKKVTVIRDEETKDIQVSKSADSEEINQAQSLDKILNKKNTVLVEPGQNSISSENLKNVTLPVKISPLQLNVLYKNHDFVEKDEANNRIFNEKDLKDYKFFVKSENQLAPPEGIKNEKAGIFAPRAGGLIDIQTGLYVAPGDDARFDPKDKIYVSENVGEIEKDTGVYLAPKGLKLDAKKGFVVLGEAKEPKLLAQRDDLNLSINRNDLILPKDINEEVIYKISEKYIHDEISVSLYLGGQELKVNPSQSNVMSYDLKASRDKFKVNFDWKVAAIGKTRPILGTTLSNVNFKGSMPSTFSAESSKLFGFYYGTMYALNRHFDLYAKLGIMQDHYLNQSSTTSLYTLSRVVTTKINLGTQMEFFNDSKLPLEIDLYGIYNFKKRLNTLKVKDGTGLGLTLGTKYNYSKKNYLTFGIFSESQNVKVQGESGENELERKNGGIKFGYLYRF